MEYKIIYALDMERLEASVNAAIGRGWRPTGGVTEARAELGHIPRCSQAMIREKKKEIVMEGAYIEGIF